MKSKALGLALVVAGLMMLFAAETCLGAAHAERYPW